MQETLQADWQEAWHSPQPVFLEFLQSFLPPKKVLICSIKTKASKNQCLLTLSTPPIAPDKTAQKKRNNTSDGTIFPKKTQQIKRETKKTKRPERLPIIKPLHLK